MSDTDKKKTDLTQNTLVLHDEFAMAGSRAAVSSEGEKE